MQMLGFSFACHRGAAAENPFRRKKEEFEEAIIVEVAMADGSVV